MRNTISELPDDLLVYVLSFLTVKEAGRTSVVAKSWRHMWVYNPTLNFDFRDALHSDTQITKLGMLKYVNWVDKVVNEHKAPVIDEFRVRAHIHSVEVVYCRKSIDNWFRFAMAKTVHKLEIDLSAYKGFWTIRHTFPSVPMCNSLTSLKLGCININGEVLESFLCNCKALEYLSVKDSDTLEHLKVCGPSLNLKHLKIVSVSAIKQLEISAPKLESIYYSGPKINLQFKSTPKLVQVSVGGSYADSLANICSDLSSYLSQIKVFRVDCLGLRNSYVAESAMPFTRLEKLDVNVVPDLCDDLYYFASMIKACPFLQHFTLRLCPLPRPAPAALKYHPYKTREQWEASPHYHLKILEILGFMGYQIDMEFVTYLMESALSLVKIIADTRHALPNSKKRRLARKQAERLRANLKPNCKLEIV